MNKLTWIAKAFDVDDTSAIVLSLALVAAVTSLPSAAQETQETAATPETVPAQETAPAQEDVTTQEAVTNEDAGAESPISGELGVPASEVATPQLGRLFLTPEQRRQLDALRDRGPVPPQVARVVEPEAEPEAEPEPELEEPEGPVVSELTINGMVLRKGGLSAAWVNGAPIQSGSVTREGIVVRTGRGSVRVVLPSGAQSVRLKPGQKVDIVSGSVYEPYDCRRLRLARQRLARHRTLLHQERGRLMSPMERPATARTPKLLLRDILLRLAAPKMMEAAGANSQHVRAVSGPAYALTSHARLAIHDRWNHGDGSASIVASTEPAQARNFCRKSRPELRD